MKRFVLLLSVALGIHSASPAKAGDTLRVGHRMTDQQVSAFARLAMDGIPREFPNKPSNVMVDADSAKRPRQLHPVFFGCFDWHSSVHGHWMLVRLAKQYPQASCVAQIHQLLDEQFTADKLAAEAAYFDFKQNRSFERMYGWAWTLRLAAELKSWDHPSAKRWSTNLAPLEQRIVQLTKAYLPKLTYPIRTGVHPDTAFALSQIFDYSRTVGDSELEAQIVAFALDKYQTDANYSGQLEPSGEDFFSPAWNEADLMRRVLTADEFSTWLRHFLPKLDEDDSASWSLLTPVVVSDPSDPKIVHLAGLNLSRAWTQYGVLSALPAGDSRRSVLERSVASHSQAGLDYVFSGHYEGEHWLATFAVYGLTKVGTE